MKSLLISGIYFPPNKGGISHLVGRIAHALGPERICCLTAIDSNGSKADDLGLSVFRNKSAFSRALPVQLIGISLAAGEIMLTQRPRVIQLATVDDAHIGLWLRAVLRLPLVIYAHGNEILEAARMPWPKPRIALQTADHIFANSRFTAGLVERVGVDPAKITLLHPGCDLQEFRPRPANLDLKRKLVGSADKRIILTVGGLVARKGHDMVLRALPRLIQRIPDLTYLIVGDGRDRHRLESLVQELQLTKHVVFAGEITDEDLPEIYALSEMFVMPSRENMAECDVEGFGLVYLEAGASGKPVVAGRSGGISDAVIDDVTGLLVDPGNPEQVGAAIEQLLTDKQLAQRLGSQGRSRLVGRYEWSRVASRVQTVLEASFA